MPVGRNATDVATAQSLIHRSNVVVLLLLNENWFVLRLSTMWRADYYSLKCMTCYCCYFSKWRQWLHVQFQRSISRILLKLKHKLSSHLADPEGFLKIFNKYPLAKSAFIQLFATLPSSVTVEKTSDCSMVRQTDTTRTNWQHTTNS